MDKNLRDRVVKMLDEYEMRADAHLLPDALCSLIEERETLARIDELGRIQRLVKGKYPELLIIVDMLIEQLQQQRTGGKG